MGPYCFNFSQICDQLQQAGNLQIAAPSQLQASIETLLQDAEQRHAMGAAGLRLMEQQKGAQAKHINHLVPLLAL